MMEADCFTWAKKNGHTSRFGKFSKLQKQDMTLHSKGFCDG